MSRGAVRLEGPGRREAWLVGKSDAIFFSFSCAFWVWRVVGSGGGGCVAGESMVGGEGPG